MTTEDYSEVKFWRVANDTHVQGLAVGAGQRNETEPRRIIFKFDSQKLGGGGNRLPDLPMVFEVAEKTAFKIRGNAEAPYIEFNDNRVLDIEELAIGTNESNHVVDIQHNDDVHKDVVYNGTNTGLNTRYRVIAPRDNNAFIQFGDDDDVNNGRILYKNPKKQMAFITDDTEQFVINRTGKIDLRNNNISNIDKIGLPSGSPIRFNGLKVNSWQIGRNVGGFSGVDLSGDMLDFKAFAFDGAGFIFGDSNGNEILEMNTGTEDVTIPNGKLDLNDNDLHNVQYMNHTVQSGDLNTCDSTWEGATAYNGTHWGCDGTSWNKLY